MKKSARFRAAAGIAIASLGLASAACSVLLSTSPDQCSIDADCAHLAGYPVCRGGVCVASSSIDSGGDATSANDGAHGDAADAACPPFTPTTPDDFLNQCTASQCIPFDNCARLHLCGDAALPALIDPVDAAPPVDSAPPADAEPE